MKIRLIYFLLLSGSFLIKSQNTVLARVSPLDNKTIEIKWYCPKIVNTEGFNVYRKENKNSEWKKLNSNPVVFKSYQIPPALLEKDKELKSYLELVSNPENIKDLALLAVLIKSFKSNEFSKYLGIRYDDTYFEQGK